MDECVSPLRTPLGAGGSPSWWSQGLEGRRGVLSAGKRYFPGETPSPTLSGEGAFLFLGLGHLSPASFHFFRLADSLWVSKPRSPPGFEAELTWEGGILPPWPRYPPRTGPPGWARLSEAASAVGVFLRGGGEDAQTALILDFSLPIP